MKKILIIALCFLLLIISPIASLGASSEAEYSAKFLNELGLFKGVGTDSRGNPIFDLDRKPTRQESITMLVRILGKEQEALQGNWLTPFNDVDRWAQPYVGYAYNNELAKGMSSNTFGSNEIVSYNQYLTFVLRALGYIEGVDFKWDNAKVLAEKIGLTKDVNVNIINFSRGDVAIISANALSIGVNRVIPNQIGYLENHLVNSEDLLSVEDSSKEPTLVSGIIKKDTVWSAQNSPYMIESRIQVAEGVNLTIEEGVRVYPKIVSSYNRYGDTSFSDCIIELYGATINIQGSKNNKVILDEITIIPKYSNEIESRVVANHTYFNGGNPCSDRATVTIMNSTLIKVKTMDLSWPFGDVNISNNIFNNCDPIRLGTWNLNNDYYKGQLIDNGGEVNIFNNVFLGNKDNLLFYNFPEGLSTIKYNSFLGTGSAIVVDKHGSADAIIKADYNYWGDGGLASANNKIIDKSDDLARMLTVTIKYVIDEPHKDTPTY